MSGSFTEGLRKRIAQKEEAESSKEVLADKFNHAASHLIEEFLMEVNSGNVKIDDTADLMRLFQIYGDMNDLHNMTSDGGGSLPSLSARQSSNIKKYVETEEREGDDGEEDYVDPNSLAALTAEDVEEMMNEREVEVNADNAEEWEEGIGG